MQLPKSEQLNIASLGVKKFLVSKCGKQHVCLQEYET